MYTWFPTVCQSLSEPIFWRRKIRSFIFDFKDPIFVAVKLLARDPSGHFRKVFHRKVALETKLCDCFLDICSSVSFRSDMCKQEYIMIGVRSFKILYMLFRI